MKAGDFVFYKTNSVSGRLIRRLQKKLFGNRWEAEVNHIAFCVEAPDIMREAKIPESFVAKDVDYKRKIVAIVRPTYLMIMQDDLKQEFFEEQKKIVGYSYGIQQIIGMWVWTALALFGINLRTNPIRAGRICTEDCFLAKKDMEMRAGFNDPINRKFINADTIYPGYFLVLLGESNYYRVMRS